ncbi:MAG: hypothetical protein RIC52_04965, partial [Amphiplicatus sp.]
MTTAIRWRARTSCCFQSFFRRTTLDRRAKSGGDRRMSLRELYPIPNIDPTWSVPQGFEAVFDWD